MGNSAEPQPQSVQPKWDGFGIRLGRAIDRWPGGGQRAFAEALAGHAKREGLRIPTSYRTLVNYLQENTRPSVAWVEAAATVLRWRVENLLAGEGPEREEQQGRGMTFKPNPESQPRMSALVNFFVNRNADIPWPARLMILNFLDDYFRDDADGWEVGDWHSRRPQVEGVVDAFFAPLLARQRMGYAATMALAASLTAAAYIRLEGE